MDPRLRSATDMLSASFDTVEIARAIIAASDTELHTLFSFEIAQREGGVETYVLRVPQRSGGFKTENYTVKKTVAQIFSKTPVQENIEAVLSCADLDFAERGLFYLKIAQFMRQDDLVYFLVQAMAPIDGKINGGSPWKAPLLHEIEPIIALAAFRQSWDASVRAGAARMLARGHCWLNPDFVCRELGRRIAGDPEVRSEVAESLKSYGKLALPTLCDLLSSDHKFTKHAALEIIMDIAEKDAKGVAGARLPGKALRLEGETALEKMARAGFEAHAIAVRIAAGEDAEAHLVKICSLLSSKERITAQKACDMLAEREKRRLSEGFGLDEGVLWRLSAAGFAVPQMLIRIGMEEAEAGRTHASLLGKLRDAGFGAHAVGIEIAAGGNVEDFVSELCGHLPSKNHSTSGKACELLVKYEKDRLRRGHDLDLGVLRKLDGAGFATRADYLRRVYVQCLQRPKLIALAVKKQDTPRTVRTAQP